MSKMDNLRAMREAKYAAAQARAGGSTAASRTAARRTAPVAPPTTAAAAAPAEASVDALCGHRNISGRTCTREKGHAAKNHRYS